MKSPGFFKEGRRTESERGKGKPTWHDPLSDELEQKKQKQSHIIENLIYQSLGIEDQGESCVHLTVFHMRKMKLDPYLCYRTQKSIPDEL